MAWNVFFKFATNTVHKVAMKESLCYFKKISEPINLLKQYILKIKERKKYLLLWKRIWTDTFIEAIHLENEITLKVLKWWIY